MVGAEGFELSTYGTQNRRATRLRYAPTGALLPKIAGKGKRLVAGPGSLFCGNGGMTHLRALCDAQPLGHSGIDL